MPQQLKYVAQLAMDNFYQAYKGEDDFWELEDFISQCGNTIAAMYMTYYQQEYAMLRQERKDEVVTFDAGWLVEQDGAVTGKGGYYSSTLTNPIMTFPYDKSSIGIQNVFITDPFSYDEVERTSLAALWQLKYLPKTDKIFFYSDVAADGAKLGFVNKGNCNIKKIKVLYVPSMVDGESVVADGLIADAISKTVLMMKQMANGNVIDETPDLNMNKVLQTELDKKTLIK